MRNALISLILVFVVVVGVLYVTLPHEPAVTTQSAPAIGGAFTLTDDEGNTVTEADFSGKYTLVFFGFTNCPDVCPTTLLSMTELMDTVDAKGERVTPLFISVDAEDTPTAMQSYLSNFHPTIVGLTGTPEQIREAAAAYKVYYARVEQPESSAGYTVDHSSFVFFMSPEGEYIRHFRYQEPVENMAKIILDEWEKR